MRLLVYPHDLSIGGSQINAIDLAAGVAAAGHDVVVYGVPGPLVDYIEERGLRFLPARRLRYRPAPSRIAQLATIASRERIDLIHAYEWPPCLDAYFGAGLLGGVPLLCTVLSMEMTPHVPPSVPLIMGTNLLGREARTLQSANVWVLEPPIDVDRDCPTIDGSAFRQLHKVTDDELLVVGVSRLAVNLKLDALVRAIDAVDFLADRYPLRLILIGDGPARTALTKRAHAVNIRHGRNVVALPGAQHDPRSAYAAADIVVGMGSSALRALAIGRPVIVQGEQAFSEVFEPATLKLFLRQGFYGLSDGAAGVAKLISQIEGLLSDASRRRELGRFGREVVVERFSLKRAVGLQLDIYSQILASPPHHSLIGALHSARLALMTEISNHNPQQKRKRRNIEEEALNAAGSKWPPGSKWSPKAHDIA